MLDDWDCREFGSPVKSCVCNFFVFHQNQKNPDLYCFALRAIVLSYRSSPAQASLSVLAQYLRTAYGLAVQLRKTVKTESRNKVCLIYAEVHPVFARTAKTVKTESRNKVCLVYAEVHPVFARTAKTKKTTIYTMAQQFFSVLLLVWWYPVRMMI